MMVGGWETGPDNPLLSFPRKRESRGGLPSVRHYKAVPFEIPAYAGMTVGGRREGRLRPPAPIPFSGFRGYNQPNHRNLGKELL